MSMFRVQQDTIKTKTITVESLMQRYQKVESAEIIVRNALLPILKNIIPEEIHIFERKHLQIVRDKVYIEAPSPIKEVIQYKNPIILTKLKKALQNKYNINVVQ